MILTDRDSGESTSAAAWFYFSVGYGGSYNEPPEAPSIELVDVQVCGRSVIDVLSSYQLNRIEGELLEAVLDDVEYE